MRQAWRVDESSRGDCMAMFRRMTAGTFITVLGGYALMLGYVPQTRTKWVEFGVLCLFFAFLLVVLFSNRPGVGRKPRALAEESMR
jgi:hypothetical protein